MVLRQPLQNAVDKVLFYQLFLCFS